MTAAEPDEEEQPQRLSQQLRRKAEAYEDALHRRFGEAPHLNGLDGLAIGAALLRGFSALVELQEAHEAKKG